MAVHMAPPLASPGLPHTRTAGQWFNARAVSIRNNSM